MYLTVTIPDYRRAVIVIMRKDQEENTFISAKCPSYLLYKLGKTKQNPPTADNIRLAKILMCNTGTSYEAGLQAVYGYAIFWRHAELWNEVLSCCCKSKSTLESFLDKAAEAVKVFKIKRCSQT